MYVCNCNGVTRREIDAAIGDGAGTPREVLAHHGHDPCCGRCLPEIAARLKEARPALRKCREGFGQQLPVGA